MKNAPLHQQQTKIHYTRKSFNNASLARLLGKGTVVATICSIDSLYSFTKRLTDAFCCGKPESNKTKQNWSRLRNGKEKFPLVAHIKIFAVGFFFGGCCCSWNGIYHIFSGYANMEYIAPTRNFFYADAERRYVFIHDAFWCNNRINWLGATKYFVSINVVSIKWWQACITISNLLWIKYWSG